MNIQITEYQLSVINQMIAIKGLSLTPEAAIYEMLIDDVNCVERTLTELKELKAKQQQLINRSKLHVVR